MSPFIVQMNPLNLIAAYPEILLLLLASTVLLIEGFKPGSLCINVHAASLTSLCGISLLLLAFLAGDVKSYAFSRLFVVDSLASLLKLVACLSLLASFICGRRYAANVGMLRGEWYVLGLFSLLGQMILISANHMLVVYLGVELMSLALYAAVALRRDHAVSAEAAMKYFVLGALASGFLLYGISMLYGATGTLHLSLIPQVIATGQANPTILSFAIVFLVAGMAFKLGAVPFHMWVPDVYQGSPTAVTMLISTGPKLAAFAMVLRVLVQGLPSLANLWQPMWCILAVASLAIGNLTAIVQTSLKRMLAYSAIGQVGFVLLGLMSGVVDGNNSNAASAYSAALFYSIAYVVTTVGTFGLIAILTTPLRDFDNIADLRGLSRKHPWLALLMMVFMFSLTGIPPTIGFQAKFAVLGALLNAGHVVLAVVAVMFSLIAAYYYLRIVKAMYFDSDEADSHSDTTLEPMINLSTNASQQAASGMSVRVAEVNVLPLAAVIVIAFIGLAILAGGIMPSALLEECTAVINQFLRP